MKFPTRLIQCVFILIPLGLFVWLFSKEIVPSGEFVIHHNVHDASPYIDQLAPSSRLQAFVKEEGTWTQTIIGDPVFFFLHPHRSFEKLSFKFWFQNPDVPIVEFGGLVKSNPDVYDLQPLDNRLIDTLSWNQVTDGALTLWQKTPIYDSLKSFFAHPPSRNQVAVYKTDYLVPFRLPGYTHFSQTQTVEVSLRGTQKIKTYIKNEPLHFVFDFMDMNRDVGADAIAVTVFNEQGAPVADGRAVADTDEKNDTLASAMKTLTLDVPNLPEGVYTLSVDASRDIFIRQIHTTQQKMIFLNTVFLGDETGYQAHPTPIQFWTISDRLKMQTRHSEGVQDVLINGEKHTIAQPYTLYTFDSNATLSPVNIPKGDLEIFFNGPIAFEKNQFFQPDPLVIQPNTKIEGSDIAYVLSTYKPPEHVGNWLVQTINIDTPGLLLDKKSWKFTFSTPEIESVNGHLKMRDINMKWMRPRFILKDLFSLFGF